MVENFLLGNFYYKQTINGNIIGEFSNNNTDNIYTESCDLINRTTADKFIGIYLSSWVENDESHKSNLEISFKYKKNKRIYKLVWIVDGKEKFDGEGILCAEHLIGFYKLC